MLNFTYLNESEIIFGRRDEKEVGQLIKKLGYKKVLLHYGQGSVIKTGVLEKIKNALSIEGVEFVEYGGVKANPLKSHAIKGIELVRKKNIDFVLAIGGGSVIDSAKCIAVGGVNEDFWSYYLDESKELQEALPVGVVLTIPAAGSEGSTASVIKDDQDNLKYSLKANCIRPRFAFINPEYCFSLPKSQIANGASDILAHLLESYFSPVENTVFTDKLLTGAIQALFKVAPMVYNENNNYNYWAELCLIGTLAHNGMLKMGREVGDWASHRIENRILSGVYDIAHGEGLAIVFPALLKYIYKKNPSRLDVFAKEVMEIEESADKEESFLKAINKLECFYKSLNLSTRLKDKGIEIENIEELVEKCLGKVNNLGGYSKINNKDIVEILKLAE